MYYKRCRSHNRDVSESTSATTQDISGGAIPRSCPLVPGEGVTSLDQHLGGTHPSSPLYQLVYPQEIALSDLQLPHTAKNQETFHEMSTPEMLRLESRHFRRGVHPDTCPDLRFQVCRSATRAPTHRLRRQSGVATWCESSQHRARFPPPRMRPARRWFPDRPSGHHRRRSFQAHIEAREHGRECFVLASADTHFQGRLLARRNRVVSLAAASDDSARRYTERWWHVAR